MNKEKILIVDDDEPLREMYRERFEAEGYEVDEALDGESALAKVQKSLDYDCILLDIMLPKVSGIDVLESLKSLSDTKGIPIVMLTALGKGSTEDRASKAGADAYLTKADTMPGQVVAKVKVAITKNKHSLTGKYLRVK